MPVPILSLIYRGRDSRSLPQEAQTTQTRAQPVSPLRSSLVHKCTNVPSLVVNLRYTFHPAAIVYPNNAQDVSTAMKIGVQYNHQVVARSGGHSYIANGLGGKDGLLVVDMSNFKTVYVDSSTNVATIGPGNRLGDVALALNNNGRAMPHGTCPYVGIGGHSGWFLP